MEGVAFINSLVCDQFFIFNGSPKTSIGVDRVDGDESNDLQSNPPITGGGIGVTLAFNEKQHPIC